MSVFDLWAEYIVQILNAESELAGEIIQHGVELGDAREALIKGVLSRILPGAYEIGRGEIIDSDLRRSKQIDIVIARRDSPSLLLPSGSRVYLIESVIATIEVKSELNRSSMFESLDNCASVAQLEPRVDKESYEELRKDRGVERNKDGVLYHPDSLELQRFGLIGRPATYIFGFTGYSRNLEDFKMAIFDWGVERMSRGEPLNMRHVPAVIASQGCLAFRNAAPFDKPTGQPSPDCLAYVGQDPTPLRMLIAHLLYTIQTKIPWVPDIDGLKTDPFVYIQRMGSFSYSGTIFCNKPPGEGNGE